MQLGEPDGDMYTDQHVYWRRYSGGLVLANPSKTASYHVKLSGSYRTWSNYVVKTGVNLPPHSGLVLLK
jgi:hypothetical protein